MEGTVTSDERSLLVATMLTIPPPGALLTTITAIAPACCARTTLFAKSTSG